MGCHGTIITNLYSREEGFLFDLGFVDNWKGELKLKNKKKVGRPFDFPDRYIKVSSVHKGKISAPYRMMEGAVEALSDCISFLQGICFTQIRRRISVS